MRWAVAYKLHKPGFRNPTQRHSYRILQVPACFNATITHFDGYTMSQVVQDEFKLEALQNVANNIQAGPQNKAYRE